MKRILSLAVTFLSMFTTSISYAQTLEQRKQIIAAAAEQRYIEFTGGETKYTDGTVHELKPNPTR